jgi:hypothetical protein
MKRSRTWTATAATLCLAVLTAATAPGGQGTEPPEALRQARALEKAGRYAEALAVVERLIDSLPDGERMACWRYVPSPGYGRIGHAWPAGERVVLRLDHRRALWLDAETGEAAPLPIGDVGGGTRRMSLHVSPAGRRLVVLAADERRDRRVCLIDPRSGRALESLAGQFNPRMDPVPCADGFAAIRGNRLVRMRWSGEPVWQVELPGAGGRPAWAGCVLAIAARSSTSVIDLDAGRRLWSGGVGTYERGTVIGDGAAYLVQTGIHLSPQRTQTLAVGREPRTGKQLWRYVVAGLPGGPPLLWRAEHRVYLLGQTGRVVCLDGRSGKLCWCRRLPAPPPRPRSGEHAAGRAIMRLQDRTLIVLDARYVAHFLDAADGTRRASFPLVPSTLAFETGDEFNEPVAAPWLAGGRLIVPTARWLAAFPAAPVLAGRPPVELLARAVRTRLLYRLGKAGEAKAELKTLRQVRPTSPVTIALQAEMYGPGRPLADRDSEVIARLRHMRRTGAERDTQLYRLTGLLRRLDAGPGATRPLVLGPSLYVGTHCGTLLRYDLATLRPQGRLDLDVGIISDPTFHDEAGGLIVFGTANRHTVAASLEPAVVFDLPSLSGTRYRVLGRRLIRIWPAIPYTRLSVLDVQKRQFGPQVHVDRQVPGAVVHNGRLYFTRGGGATASYDGERACVHECRMTPQDFAVQRIEQAAHRIRVGGSTPICYGNGGVFAADEHLRPARRIIPSATRVFAAAVNGNAIATLREQAESTKPWLLEAWTADGATRLALHHETPRYSARFDPFSPMLLPLADGFLLVGRDLLYVRAGRKAPLWRFWPGYPQQDWGLAFGFRTFGEPVMLGRYLLVTHRYGDVLVFDTSHFLKGR